MFLQGLIIAGLGMNLLQSLQGSETNRNKIAAAIAFALHNNHKK